MVMVGMTRRSRLSLVAMCLARVFLMKVLQSSLNLGLVLGTVPELSKPSASPVLHEPHNSPTGLWGRVLIFLHLALLYQGLGIQ